jgi:hypothetical protein
MKGSTKGRGGIEIHLFFDLILEFHLGPGLPECKSFFCFMLSTLFSTNPAIKRTGARKQCLWDTKDGKSMNNDVKPIFSFDSK